MVPVFFTTKHETVEKTVPFWWEINRVSFVDTSVFYRKRPMATTLAASFVVF